MAIPTSQLKNWGVVQWQTQIKHAAPSTGGAVGVMFVWCRFPGSDGPDYNNVGTADFVIKPAPGSSAPTKFAEKLMSQTMGAVSTNTLPVPHGDVRFNAILSSLHASKMAVERAMQYRGPNVGPPSTALCDLNGRWSAVWPHYTSAGAWLVQELAQGMSEFADVYRMGQASLASLLGNQALMRNLGKLFAVDAVLGNGDRLCSLNTGNILFKQTTAQIFSVDSQAILTSYQRLLTEGSVKVKTYVDQIVEVKHSDGFQLPEKPGAVVARSFSVADLYDVDEWWRRMFRGHLESNFILHLKWPSPSEQVWSQALFWFKGGLDEGLRAVDSQLSGLNWLLVKNKFKNYEQRYGSSPNLDWTNFKIRRMYVKMVLADRNKPGTPAEKQQRAMDKVVAYAQRKLGSLEV